MDIFTKIAEQRIQEALKHGEFNNLENRGRPLDLKEDPWLPQDLRLAYKVLKNAGCLPPELELRKEIISLRDLIDTLDDNKERLSKIRQLNAKLLALNTRLDRPVYLDNLWDKKNR